MGSRREVAPRPKLSDAVVDHLLSDVVAGRLLPGDELPSEADLTAQFGISKVVVREAIAAVDALGIVQVRHGKRTTVADPDEWEVLAPQVQAAFWAAGRGAQLLKQLYEARLMVEPDIAALAAARADDEQVAALSELATRLESIAGGDRDREQFLHIDSEFHDLLGRMSGNVAVRAMARDLHRYLSPNWEDSRLAEGDLKSAAAQHRRIARAIEQRKPDAARAAMQKHIEWASQVEVQARLVGHAAPETALPSSPPSRSARETG